MSRSLKSLAVILCLLLSAISVFPPPASAQPPGAGKISTPGGYDEVIAEIGRAGSVRLIVKVDAPFQPIAAPDSAASRRQQEHIASVQNEVLSSLAPFNPRAVHRFVYTPFIFMEVDAAALHALLALHLVLEVREDIPEYPTLDVSVPRIGAPSLWDFYGAGQGFDGAGITVAVLDTGVDKTHPFLSGAVVSEACYSTNDPSAFAQSLCPGGVTHSTASGSAMPYASGLCPTTPVNNCDHGTHVAGIIAGRQGVALSPGPGVASGSDIIAIQVFSLIGGQVAAYQSDVMKGLERTYALRTLYDIASVNMSLGGTTLYPGYCDSDPRKPIIDSLRAAGVATVVSSGNNGAGSAGSCGSITAPACISSVISVGATDDLDSVGTYSNSAAFMSVFAPGTSINSSIPGPTYQNMSGTSMAAPHVSGAWALLKQAKPGESVDQVLAAFTSTGLSVTDSKCLSVTKRRISVIDAFNSLGSGPSAETLPATGITQTSAVLNGRVNANNTGTTVTFEYGTTTAYGGSVTALQSPVSATALTHVDQTVTGLSQNTLYHFRVKADNGSVVSYGSDMTFTTIGPCASISDGGFESGTPNMYWTETSTNFGTPLCTSSICGGAGPRTGAWWAWFGGVTGATEAASLTQNVFIPAGSSPRIEFYLWNNTSSGNGSDSLKMKVDGADILSVLEGNPAYGGGFALTGIDLSAYADGASHALSFESTTTGPAAANFNLDDVSITCGPATTLPIVSTDPATSAGATGATLNGTINANNSSTAVSFEYGTTTAYGSTAAGFPSTVAGGANTPVSAAIGGLTPNTAYHFRAVGSSATGISYGGDMTFTTLSCAPGDVRIGGTPHPTIQQAIEAAVNLDVIEVKSLDFNEDLLFQGAGTVTLKGGFDCAFFSNTGYTTVAGPGGAGGSVMLKDTRTVIFEHIILR